MDLVLRVRLKPEDPWIQNFHLGGWKVRNPENTGWIDVTPLNTQIANPDFNANQLPDPISNPAWLNFKKIYDIQNN